MSLAVITGAANGIGLQLSRLYLESGASVFMVDKDLEKLEQEANSLGIRFANKVHYLCCDITQTPQVEALSSSIYEQFGGIDWLFNNAGIIGQLGPVWEQSAEQIKRVMDVNLFGMINMVRAFMPYLLQQDGTSHIINIASLYALYCSTQTAAYSMSKHAVLAFTEALYFDLQPLNKPISISVAFPSFTDTGLLANHAEGVSTFQQSLNNLLSYSRPANEVAEQIFRAVEQKQFYIFPDKEVKAYCLDRVQAMVQQEKPFRTNVENLLSSLVKRST